MQVQLVGLLLHDVTTLLVRSLEIDSVPVHRVHERLLTPIHPQLQLHVRRAELGDGVLRDNHTEVGAVLEAHAPNDSN